MPAPLPPGIPPEGQRAAGRVSLCPAVRFASEKKVRRASAGTTCHASCRGMDECHEPLDGPTQLELPLAPGIAPEGSAPGSRAA